jgi:hypothetical protein
MFKKTNVEDLRTTKIELSTTKRQVEQQKAELKQREEQLQREKETDFLEKELRVQHRMRMRRFLIAGTILLLGLLGSTWYLFNLLLVRHLPKVTYTFCIGESALPRGNYERPQPVPCIRKMCCKALPRLHRARKIVMLLVRVWRRMLEHPRDQANLLRCVDRQKGRCCATEVMKTHGLSNNT